MNIVSGKVIRGIGYTPKKGVDYWTDEDKKEIISDLLASSTGRRVTSLTETGLACDTVIEAIGNPIYVGIDDIPNYSGYGIEDTGWYVFARISAIDGVEVSDETTIDGAAGGIIETGADYVDVAVRFEVASMSQTVVIDWDGEHTDIFVFKATDLAVRNLDDRVTFYVYDIDDYTRWSYKKTDDVTYVGTKYYTEDDGVYTQAAVKAYEHVPADTYYVDGYILTEDIVFVDGKTYYTCNDDDSTYTAAEVTAGETVPANTYYIKGYVLTTDKIFAGTAYYEKTGEEYTQAAVKAGEAAPVFFCQTGDFRYTTTKDETFSDGKTYYILNNSEYIAAGVNIGDAVPANTYYEKIPVYAIAEDDVFEDGKAYYMKDGDAYTEFTVTAGDPIPAVYVHSKVYFEGMVRNITYRLNTIIDCPMEFILPEIDDETHGCWFEIRCQHAGEYSMTLTPPSDDIKIATEHTQKEKEGINMINLHYTVINGIKVWRFLNTHSTIPT